MKTLLAFVLVLSIAAPAFAATNGKPPKKLVEDLSKASHEVFITVKNPEGQTLVKPEDAKKLKYPLTTYEEREFAVARGSLSGYAKWCGLEWEKDYYLPYMAALKKEHKKNWTPYQYAYTEVLHGMAMGAAVGSKKGVKCDDAEKKRIAALAKK
jgi:hypothetical protein